VPRRGPGPGGAEVPAPSQAREPARPAVRPGPVTPPPVASPAPRGLTPGPDYRLAPGDLLDVQIAGRLDVIRQQTYVDLAGVINVPPLGPLPVGGLTLREAHRRVSQRARDVVQFADATLT